MQFIHGPASNTESLDNLSRNDLKFIARQLRHRGFDIRLTLPTATLKVAIRDIQGILKQRLTKEMESLNSLSRLELEAIAETMNRGIFHDPALRIKSSSLSRDHLIDDICYAYAETERHAVESAYLNSLSF